MANCKICGKSDIAMYCICKDCLDKVENKNNGLWIKLGMRTYGTSICPTHYCSICGEHGLEEYEYCPHCGNKMKV